MNKGIYSRGYLPHWDFAKSLQAITFRDRFIRDPDHYHECVAYIRNNPVKAGLCRNPEDWPYSSTGIGWSADFSPPESESPPEPQAD